MKKEIKDLVEDRIAFIQALTDVKESFRGIKLIKLSPEGCDHPYKHFSALRIYLALTCFDILGQQKEHYSYNNWLEASLCTQERNEIINKYKNIDLNEALKNIYKDYNEIYGVRNSFNYFINKVLSPDNRRILLESVRIVEFNKNDIKNREEIYNEGKKIDFLYKIRNLFTHKGLSMGVSSGGLLNFEEDPIFIPELGQTYLFNLIYSNESNNKLCITEYYCRNWPTVLINILRDTIKFI